jgi:hypothetical protein|tara:strand:- start:1707 stop:2030 length:324 start_codon:yes stop_codon:yes gene_type:complete
MTEIENMVQHEKATGPVAAASNLIDKLMSGGRKFRRSKSVKKAKSKRSMKGCASRRKCSKKGIKRGGMGHGFGAILKKAIVPFGIFAWQKKRSGKKTFRKSRRSGKR